MSEFRLHLDPDGSEPHTVSEPNPLDLYRENQRLEAEVATLREQLATTHNACIHGVLLEDDCAACASSVPDANTGQDLLQHLTCREGEAHHCANCGRSIGPDLAPALNTAGADALRDALEDMVNQFAPTCSRDGVTCLGTMGLSSLEYAFEVLGWDDPHPVPERQCDEPGCAEASTCGWPSPAGYRRTCGKHLPHPGRTDDE
jgi:hypothetical protein